MRTPTGTGMKKKWKGNLQYLGMFSRTMKHKGKITIRKFHRIWWSPRTPNNVESSPDSVNALTYIKIMHRLKSPKFNLNHVILLFMKLQNIKNGEMR